MPFDTGASEIYLPRYYATGNNLCGQNSICSFNCARDSVNKNHIYKRCVGGLLFSGRQLLAHAVFNLFTNCLQAFGQL